MHLAQQLLSRGRPSVDAVDDEADVSLIALALWLLREAADVFDRQWMQVQQLAEPTQLSRFRVVQVKPEELVRLQVPRGSIELARIEYGERPVADTHPAQIRPGPGGPGSRAARALVRYASPS